MRVCLPAESYPKVGDNIIAKFLNNILGNSNTI